mmetsp:Transcript_48539/g.96754  ORF Transcript_48539/g.96754 Transcript_48539/m.96754 type:complete len:376 (-) Transcript_48539:668-1795(-)
MNDPSQSASQAAGRQDRAAQEAFRAKIQEGALTGLAERNTKWDVEYEGKDAVGTLVRPFEPGYGDSRRLPEKMLGEDISAAVARSMGKNLPHSGAGDGVHVFKTDWDPERLAKMRAASAKGHSPPPGFKKDPKEVQKGREQQRRLEEQWSVGLTGGSYGMHTRHVRTVAPSTNDKRSKATLGKESPVVAAGHLLGVTPEAGPPVVSTIGYRKPNSFKPVTADGEFDGTITFSRSPAGPDKIAGLLHEAPPRLRGDAGNKYDGGVDTLDMPNQGAHDMLDRMGPNIASGPIPRDGFTTDAYAEYTKKKLRDMGYSDIRGEHGARPDELENGIDHLDKLETLGKSAKDMRFQAGFTGNKQLQGGGAKLVIGKGIGSS